MKISVANRFDPSPIGSHFAAVRVGPDKAFSRGVVRLKSADPRQEPYVAFNLLSDERDLMRMREGVRFVYRLLSTPEVQAVSYSVFAGAYTRWLRALRSGGRASNAVLSLAARILDSGPLARRSMIRLAFPRGASVHAMTADVGLLDEWVRETVLGNWHACGTCRMGDPADRAAVVDPQGRVIGIEGLRVADASIMPSVPCANTNLSTVMIGEKISAAILAEGPGQRAEYIRSATVDVLWTR
jgi:5-(hydroxymethyl)furfural/furfural oxidase